MKEYGHLQQNIYSYTCKHETNVLLSTAFPFNQEVQRVQWHQGDNMEGDTVFMH